MQPVYSEFFNCQDMMGYSFTFLTYKELNSVRLVNKRFKESVEQHESRNSNSIEYRCKTAYLEIIKERERLVDFYTIELDSRLSMNAGYIFSKLNYPTGASSYTPTTARFISVKIDQALDHHNQIEACLNFLKQESLLDQLRGGSSDETSCKLPKHLFDLTLNYQILRDGCKLNKIN